MKNRTMKNRMVKNRINIHSLRVRLCLWYVLLSMVSMAALGAFSFVYLRYALASSRQKTMERRETRFLIYLHDEPAVGAHLSLQDQVRHFMQANSDTDILQISDMQNSLIFLGRPNASPIAWSGDGCTQPCFSLLRLGQHDYRTLQQVVQIQGSPYHLTMAGMIDEHYDILKMVETSYLIFLPLMFVVSIAGGFMLSHRALEPVARITRSAHLISIRDLNHRLPVPHTGDELQRLAETWNDLLERLEGAVKRLTQFTGDVSHDLRTSITVMLSTSQLALRRDRRSGEYRTALETILAECQSTATLLDDLLAAARSDIVKQKVEWTTVDLAVLVAESCDHLRARAEIKSQYLETRLEATTRIGGDISLLRRLVNILLDNALKYTAEEGRITVSLLHVGHRAVLEVRDTGVGIPAEEVPFIFDRFYRADASRNREQGGSGLGLAIAKWISDVHHAEITVAANQAGGSIFCVSFVEFDEDALYALHPSASPERSFFSAEALGTSSKKNDWTASTSIDMRNDTYYARCHADTVGKLLPLFRDLPF